MHNEYKVYLLRELKTDKIVYIGLTRDSLKKRFNGHVCRKKFNRNNYRIEEIKSNLSLEEAVKLEIFLIKKHDTLQNGWNKSPGSINGFSNKHTEEQKLKWSLERRGSKVSKSHALKNKKARLGHKNGDYWRQVMSKVKSKQVFCVETNTVYKNGREAANVLNVSTSKISLCCNGIIKSTKGYTFKFVKQ